MKHLLAATLFLATLLCGIPVWGAGGIVVMNGGEVVLNSQAIRMGCTDVVVKKGGSIDMGSGTITQCRHFTLNSGASLTDATGTLSLSGTWKNNSSFVQGPGSTVTFFSGCGVSNHVTGTGDTDGDGVMDYRESIIDSNSDGLPDFLDPAITVANFTSPTSVYLMLLLD
ncbi:MAG: hypothetical protein D3926_08235 [Desulfobacteraceae bacterium]|nr:MAG: hypothetical protein D3926_08235 [Desulfobacteraceae bacterium]